MANVGKNIRLLRKQKNMTQDGLAELLYVSRQTVSNYENGKSNPDIDMLVKIAEVLGTDVQVLIFGIPVQPSRKREYGKLLGALLFAAVLGGFYLWMIPVEVRWRQERFDFGLLFAMQILLRPAICIISGWALMQAVSLLWGLKRQEGKVFAQVYAVTVTLLGLYAVVMVPFCVMRLYVSCQLTRVADFSTIPYFLPDFWQGAALAVWAKLLLHFSAVFFLPGLVLWNGNGRHSGCPSVQAKETP